jgi:hypothetical protein
MMRQTPDTTLDTTVKKAKAWAGVSPKPGLQAHIDGKVASLQPLTLALRQRFKAGTELEPGGK